MIPRPRSRAGQGAGFLVLETGGRHIGDIAGLAGLVAPDIAVVLNAGRAHLGEFGSRQAIAWVSPERWRWGGC